ncbi:hypothetical protein HZS_1041, partial [Henneguya salminicola]
MDSNFDSKKFVVRERYRFFTEIQRIPTESIQELAARVREKAATCDLFSISDPLDEALKTVFVCAVDNEAILKSIFHRSGENLTFSQIEDIATEVEDASSSNLTFSQIVDIATEVEDASSSAKAQISQKGSIYKIDNSLTNPDKHIRTSYGPCYSCGKKGHSREKCKFRDSICNFCGLKGHIEVACKKKKGGERRNKFKNQKKIDTGAVESFISYENWIRLGKPVLQETSSQYCAGNGTDYNILGTFSCNTKLLGKNICKDIDLLVTNYPNLNLL